MTHYGIQKGEPIASIKIRNLAVHTGAVAAFFVPFDWSLVVLLAVTWLLRVIGVEAGYHRYFAHRAFKTSRAFQFFLAVLGASSGQRGPLWWALHHPRTTVTRITLGIRTRRATASGTPTSAGC